MNETQVVSKVASDPDKQEEDCMRTPGDYLQSVREFLGEIDLDPASNSIANEVVQAKQIYTANDNGLERPWNGRVFVNQPKKSASV